METFLHIFGKIEQIPFKSYYVVWKLNDINTKDTVERQFKSYYVVWKLAYFVSKNKYIFGLNRTM